jgi:hypothetical protein
MHVAPHKVSVPKQKGSMEPFATDKRTSAEFAAALESVSPTKRPRTGAGEPAAADEPAPLPGGAVAAQLPVESPGVMWAGVAAAPGRNAQLRSAAVHKTALAVLEEAGAAAAASAERGAAADEATPHAGDDTSPARDGADSSAQAASVGTASAAAHKVAAAAAATSSDKAAGVAAAAQVQAATAAGADKSKADEAVEAAAAAKAAQVGAQAQAKVASASASAMEYVRQAGARAVVEAEHILEAQKQRVSKLKDVTAAQLKAAGDAVAARAPAVAPPQEPGSTQGAASGGDGQPASQGVPLPAS